MSSTYLTSENMTIISRLLFEIRELGRAAQIRKLSVRPLIKRFEKGIFDENRLPIVLRRFLGQQKLNIAALDRWNNEGGSVTTGATG